MRRTSQFGGSLDTVRSPQRFLLTAWAVAGGDEDAHFGWGPIEKPRTRMRGPRYSLPDCTSMEIDGLDAVDPRDAKDANPTL